MRTQQLSEKIHCGTTSNILPSTNELVALFRTALDRMPSDNHKIVIRADKAPAGQHAGRFNAPTIDEVAIVIVDENLNNRDIVLHRRNDQLQRVSETHRSYDALQYPILFWQGEDGYHFSMKMINPVTGKLLTIYVYYIKIYVYSLKIYIINTKKIVYRC